MANDEQTKLTYEQKEARLDEILSRLDNSETPMDELASEAKEAAGLITSMHATLRSARHEIIAVFEQMEQQKEALGANGRNDASSEGESAF
jgi:exodeoxyribonuclease VII small subunit